MADYLFLDGAFGASFGAAAAAALLMYRHASPPTAGARYLITTNVALWRVSGTVVELPYAEGFDAWSLRSRPDFCVDNVVANLSHSTQDMKI